MAIEKLALPVTIVVTALVTTLVITSRPQPVSGASAATVAQPKQPALSAAMLRRLAEAADGYRTGQETWIVMAKNEPYEVMGGFTDPKEAERVRGDTSRNGVHGPYVTPRDYDRAIVFVPRPHFPPTRYGRDSLWMLPERPWRVEDVDSMVITAFHHSGPRWRVASRGLEVDALFFTLAAQDKFVFPYYATVSGLATARAMRDSLGDYVQREPLPRGRP